MAANAPLKFFIIIIKKNCDVSTANIDYLIFIWQTLSKFLSMLSNFVLYFDYVPFYSSVTDKSDK